MMERCDECGFSYGSLAESDIAPAIAGAAEALGVAIVEPRVSRLVRLRPAPDVWSALEYACHVRDVLLIQRDRVLLALVEDAPSFARMYRDERVALAGYADEDPGDVANHLGMAAHLVARVFDGLTPAQLARPCVYNFPAAARRDVAWLGRHAAHEASHHLGDVRAVLVNVSG